jgi:hypothetical protein
LCKTGARKIISWEYVKQKVTVYTLEVAGTHTFFVGYHGALTHNMVLPIAMGLGFSVPFGAVTGSAAGSFFGPITLAAGAALGTVAGFVTSLTLHDSVSSYDVKLGNIRDIDELVQRYQSFNDAMNNGNVVCNQNLVHDTTDVANPMPNGPKKDDDRDRKYKISEKDKHHIFRKASGHFPEDTPAARSLLERVSNNPHNFQGETKFGVKIFFETLENGQQVWSGVLRGEIRYGGINDIPAQFDLSVPNGVIKGTRNILP